MVDITTRSGKGSPLTAIEMDANLTNLSASIDLLVSNSSYPILLSTQSNNSNATPTTLTDHIWTLGPGKSIQINGTLVYTTAATTTGAYYGYKVVSDPLADGNIIGNWFGYTNINSAPDAAGTSDGDTISVAAGATSSGGIVSASATAGNNAANLFVLLKNTSTITDATVTLEFRSEVNASAVTAQIGSGASSTII